jgi:molybdopterin-biosynthesis enzyme MoeA-like protein
VSAGLDARAGTSTGPAPGLVFGALIIGDEILSGRRVDQHLTRVIGGLESRGHALAWAQYVGDERVRIVAALRAARAAGDVVFSFGGIGATPDDHTRQCAGEALDLPLALHPEAAVLIEARGRKMAAEKGQDYDTTGPDHQRRLQMGVIPQGATLIPNAYNTIPGFSVGRLHFMPGFPVMAHPMLDWLLDTLYADAAPERAFHAVRVKGTNESALIPVFERVELEFPGVRTFSLPSVDHPEFGAHIEMGVKGPSAAQAQAAMAALREGAAAAGASELPGTLA